MSPRLPSGALLAMTTVLAAATAVLAADPATASPGTRAAPASVSASSAAKAKADKIRNAEWWLASMHVAQAWQSSRGTGVTVALLSTGVLTSHPDLAGSVATGPDYTGSGETSGSDTWGIEGTSAASIIAGHGDNTGDASGIIGIAPAARILSIRVAFDAADPLDASATAVGRLPDAIAQGIRYAVAQDAKVIDLPLDPATLASDGAATGGLAAAAGGSAAERSAVSYALSKGAVLVAPAGDNGADGNTASFPASYPGVIALGAVGKQGALADFSTRQSYVALTAPGVGVTAASRPSGYRTMSTTDAASAMVAGTAALIRSKYPGLTSDQVRQALITGSVRPASDSGARAGAGAGTVDALKAMQAATAIASPRPSPPASSPAAGSGAVAPLTTQPKPSTVGMAKSALRDAAYAAGALIVLLLGVLLGLRMWRRRSSQKLRPAAQPRTLLGAPSGPPSGPLPVQASSARHARAGEEFAFAPAGPASPAATMEPIAPGPVAMSGPGAQAPRPAVGMAPSPPGLDRVPDSVSPRFSPSGAMPMEPGELGAAPGRAAEPGAPDADPADPPPGRGRTRKGGRTGRSAAARIATRSQANVPGGPPWAPAPAPADELLQQPRPRAPDPFSLGARPTPVPPAPWDTGPRPAVTGPPSAGPPVAGPPVAGPPVAGPPAAGPPAAGPAVTGPPVASGGPPMPWRPVPPGGTPLPGVPAPPTGVPGPPGGIPTPPTGIPAAPATGFIPPASGFIPPVADLAGSGPVGGPAGSGPAGDPGQPRPISPRDRLPLEEPAAPRPAAPLMPPVPGGPPSAWRIPGSSGRFPGAGEQSDAPGTPDPGSPAEGFPGRTGRLSRAGEFLPPYAGRPAPAGQPEPGPVPDGLPQAADPADESSGPPSGPLYIWNPAALTEPFPTSPATPATPPEGDDDAGPHPHHWA